MQTTNVARAGRVRRALALTTCAAALALAAGVAHAADPGSTSAAPANPDAAKPDYGDRVSELVVTALPATAPAIAPVLAPLQATEPTSIVTRSAIDQFVPQTGDFSQAILLTPSMSGISQNGPGLYEAKSTLRGFSDGQYNVTYDGIPFGDTNDFTHHSTSFFPASNIGAVTVERGPGTASQLGEATFGGSVNMFSPEVSDSRGASEQLTYGSWNTGQSIFKANTGDIAQLGGTHVFVALTQLITDGALTHSGAYGINEMARSVTPLSDHFTLTLFTSINYTKVYEDDNNGATRQQVALFGKDFALTDNPFFPASSMATLAGPAGQTTPTTVWPGTYYKYNTVSKQTDFEYLRLAGDFAPNSHLEQTVYTYYYNNHTVSPEDVTGARAVFTQPTLTAAGLPGPKVLGDVPGYTKINHYRVWGDITRWDWDFTNWASLHLGVWAEDVATHRVRTDMDLTLGGVPNYDQKAVVPAAPFNIQYDQHSTTQQVQPFADLVIHVVPQFTITPGFKYVTISRDVWGPYNQTARDNVEQRDTFQKPLWYFTANYKILDNWSVYGQYAQGFLAPPLSVLQVKGPTATGQVQPQQTTNYQVGTVYQSQRVTLDGDFYWINFNNLISSFTNTSSITGSVCPTNETCYENIQGATYKGVEGEATVEAMEHLFVFANGSYNKAINSRTGQQISGAPLYTAAFGGIYKAHGWSISLFDKLVGDNWQVDAACVNASQSLPCGGIANQSAYNFYKLGPYNELDLTGVYTIQRWRLEAGIYNLANSQQLYKITPNSKSSTSLSNPATLLDQVYYQPPINFQISARYTF
jgi:iron complex outermembrane receptor protein